MKKQNLFSVAKSLLVIVIYLFTVNGVKAQSIEEGQKLINVEKYNEALKVFDELVKKEPKKAINYFYLGKTQFILDKKSDAKASFEKGWSVDDDEFLNKVGLGMLQLADGDTAGAGKTFDNALEETSYKNVDVMINVADAYLLTDAKNFSRAMDVLNKAAASKNGKKNSRVYSTLGDIYMKQSNGTLANQNYQTALDYDKKNLEPYVGKAQLYIKIKNYEDAEYNLDKVLKIDSTYAPAYRVLAEYYYSKRQFDKGAENFRKYLQFSENTPDKQIRFATMLFRSNEYDEAIRLIKQLAAEGKNNDKLQHILAFSYYYKDNTAEGIPAFEKYLSMIKPEEIAAMDYEFLGKLYAKAGNDSLTVINFQKALSMDSTKTDLHGEIANIYFKNKDFKNAIKEYELKEKLTGKPLSLMEYFNLGQAAYRDSLFAKADSAYEKVIQIKPDIALAYYWRAAANASLDPESEQGLAKPHYEKFIEVASTSPEAPKYKNSLIEAYAYLGYYYYLKEDYPNAIKNYEEVLKLDPQDARATEALKTLKDPKALKSLKATKDTKAAQDQKKNGKKK